MKLLVVDHNALDPAQRVVYERLVDHGGIELRLIVPSKWFNNFEMLHYKPPLHKLTYELFPGNVLFPSRTHRLVYLSLGRHLRQFQPDVFYINAEPENFQTYEAALLTSSAKTKLVFSSWRNVDHSVQGYPYRMGGLHKAIEKYVLKRASHGIAFNRAAGPIFDTVGFHHMTHIPPPVDTSVFVPRDNPEEKRPGFVIGYVGRLVKAKGVDLILRALVGVQENYSALIVGNGPEKAALQSLSVELGLGDSVRFVDAVAPDRMPQVLSGMDLLVLPSRTTKQWKEQFGRVLIEAMACGVPVIGSMSGEIPGVVGDAGLLFKEESVEGLRLGIERLRESIALQQELRLRGLQRVEQRYSLNVVAEQFRRVFTSLCS